MLCLFISESLFPQFPTPNYCHCQLVSSKCKKTFIFVIFIFFSPVVNPYSSTEMSSRTTSDAFFLRPYLTREEYMYWNSHFNHTRPRWECQRCISPPGVTTNMIYQQRNSPASIQNVTADLTSRASESSSGFRAPHNHDFVECFYTQARDTGNAPLRYIPKRSDFIRKGGRKKASYAAHRCQTQALSKRSDSSVKDKRFAENSSSFKRMASSARQVEVYHQNLSQNYFNSAKSCGAQQETTSKSLRTILSEKYLCGDKSFDEIPSIAASKDIPDGKNHKNNARSAPVNCRDSTSTFGLKNKGGKSTNPYLLKRKNTMDTEHDQEYPQRKRVNINDDVRAGLHQVQKVNGTIDLNECFTQYLGGSFPDEENKHAQRQKTSRPQSTEQTEINQAFGIEDTAEMTHVIDESEKTQKVCSKQVEPGKDINKFIGKTTRPVHRKLSNDTGNSTSFGYALDYDCLPKVVGVMSSKPDANLPGF